MNDSQRNIRLYISIAAVICVVVFIWIMVRNQGGPGNITAFQPPPNQIHGNDTMQNSQVPSQPQAQSYYAPSAQPSYQPASADVITDRKQLWALATTAILTLRNSERHDTLDGGNDHAQVLTTNQQTLRDFWGVTDKQSLLDTLNMLTTRGHREGFNNIGQQLMSMNDDQISALLQRFQGDPKRYNAIIIVHNNYNNLGAKSLLGWDLVRYIALCRWGYGAGYISADEAWQHIMPIARQLQHRFSSWEDIGNNYVIGHMFWQANQTEQTNDEYESYRLTLLKDPSSPWVNLPWNQDLN
jgi:hypothetical protein